MKAILEMKENDIVKIVPTRQVRGQYAVQYKAKINDGKEEIFLPTHLSRAIFEESIKDKTFEVKLTEKGVRPIKNITNSGKPFKYDIKEIIKKPIINLNSYLTGVFNEKTN